jgi:hypothetical protein
MKFNINFLLAVAVLFSALFMGSCKKDDHNHDTDSDVKIILNHKWGMSGADFAMNTNLVHPMNGDTMNFTKFKYYVSNIKLKKDDGSWWVQPESYHLVDLSDLSTETITLNSVPVGEYTEMSYTLGVDSARNVSGAQSGALSTTMDMFWSWTTGYIMVKAEGNSPQSTSGNFVFHLGGFSGANNIVTEKNIQFSTDMLTVKGESTSEVHIIANPAKLYHADPLSAGTTVMMPGAKAIRMSSNFYGGFVFDKIVE